MENSTLAQPAVDPLNSANAIFMKQLLETLGDLGTGDFSARLPADWLGLEGRVADRVNEIASRLENFNTSLLRLRRQVGEEGKIGERLALGDSVGHWADRIEAVNALVDELSQPTVEEGRVIGAVAKGDLSQAMPLELEGRPLKGEYLRTAKLVNGMVGQLGAFSVEVSRVAREVGTEGKLGGQAKVKGVSGVWKELTEGVNQMAGNLTAQVRNIAEVTIAVANGDLSKKITVDVRGEILQLKEAINVMVDQLRSFAAEVTRVAREVGTEGKLGGQAQVQGVAGTWKDLTGNVNLLSATLTTQVRAIAEVATAVTKGDLTRSIQVDARGEVADLKANLNTMISNLRVTTESNQEQDWLKTNLAKFTRMLQGQRDLFTVGKMLLSELAPLVQAQQGAIYQMETDDDKKATLRLLAAYAPGPGQPERIPVGEGLVGQCAVEKQRILLNKIPRSYTRIQSSLGKASPVSVVVLPLIFEGQTKAVIELASLSPFSVTHVTFLDQLTQSIGVVLNTIEATMRTEGLLQQSQQLTVELQSQQKELQQTNEELGEKARQLADQNVEVERKNQEMEQARRALEEKAAELALTSKYKSEFLANMSHELRTPLNPVLLLASEAAEDPKLPAEVRAQFITIRNGVELEARLIDDLLDITRITHGKLLLNMGAVEIHSLLKEATVIVRSELNQKRIRLTMELAAEQTTVNGDAVRLQQVFWNVLTNAAKFTPDSGTITVGTRTRSETGDLVIAITDSGIGMTGDELAAIFEAFNQGAHALPGSSHRFGGLGLGLAISRKLMESHSGSIKASSDGRNRGSTFTMTLPLFTTQAGAERLTENDPSPTDRPSCRRIAAR